MICERVASLYLPTCYNTILYYTPKCKCIIKLIVKRQSYLRILRYLLTNLHGKAELCYT